MPFHADSPSASELPKEARWGFYRGGTADIFMRPGRPIREQGGSFCWSGSAPLSPWSDLQVPLRRASRFLSRPCTCVPGCPVLFVVGAVSLLLRPLTGVRVWRVLPSDGEFRTLLQHLHLCLSAFRLGFTHMPSCQWQRDCAFRFLVAPRWPLPSGRVGRPVPPERRWAVLGLAVLVPSPGPSI